ncbi:hypothetical protein [Sphingomonas sp.]|uniref:hypothetical protein n=1 Tax=Sphingomonas sp. TaxID=28214 RepID=UPI001EBF458D|nr:hypothetical protein [Sphingomonas sp.]MBX3594181.1 hypothetical protein [Sphingomonas sp.]
MGDPHLTAAGVSAASNAAAAAPRAAFGDPAQVDAAHKAIRADPAIQFDFPWMKVQNNPPPRWLTELFDALGRFVAWVGGGWHVLMWIAIAAIVIALLLVLARPAREWLAARMGRQRNGSEPARWTPDAAVARALLEEADALAAQGQYGQAVRLILHRSIEDIERWRGDPLRPSLTSRDIARFDGLPDMARAIFGDLVADVERSLFAGGTLAQADWTRARADYARFALGAQR